VAAFACGVAIVLGTTLRAIGRGLGNGTLDLAEDSFAKAADPRTSASVVAIAVERNAAALVPTFRSSCSISASTVHELRKVMGTGKSYDCSAAFPFEVPG